MLCFALLTRAESDVVLALEFAIRAFALARFDVQPADAVVVDEVFGGGGGCSVFHSKGIVEGKGKGASLFLCDGLFQFANLLNRLRHASAEIVDDGFATSAAKVVVVNAKLAFGFFDFGDLLSCIRRDTGEKSGFVRSKVDIHGKGIVEGKWKVASFIL